LFVCLFVFDFFAPGVWVISEIILAIMVPVKDYAVAVGFVKGIGGLLATISSMTVGALSAKDPTYWTTGFYFVALAIIQFALAAMIFGVDRQQDGRLSNVTAQSYDTFVPNPAKVVDVDDESRPLADEDDDQEY
jgi:sugar phosphate permease